MDKNRPWLRKLCILASIVVLGLLLGEVVWNLTPVRFKPHFKERYSFAILAALEQQSAGDLRGAEAALRAAISIRSNSYQAYFILGDLLQSEGKTNAALACFEAALMRCGTTPTNDVPARMQSLDRLLLAEKIQVLRNDFQPR